jgi:hypothetical protein
MKVATENLGQDNRRSRAEHKRRDAWLRQKSHVIYNKGHSAQRYTEMRSGDTVVCAENILHLEST